MMKWFNRSPKLKDCLGLDIDNQAIQMVHLVRDNSQVEIKNQIHQPIHMSPNQSKTESIIAALKSSVAQLDTTYREVIIALPDRYAFTRTVIIDSHQTDWRTAALLAIAPHVPAPLDELNIDFQPLNSAVEPHPTSSTVLGVMCYQKQLDKRVALLKQCALQPIVAELQSHAIERAYQYLYLLIQYPTVWACIETTPCAFTVLLWSKQQFRAAYSDDFIQTESAESIADQLYQNLMRLLLSHATKALSAIWLSGMHPQLLAIKQQLNQKLGLTEHTHQWRQPNLEQQFTSPVMYTALGLALREAQD